MLTAATPLTSAQRVDLAQRERGYRGRDIAVVLLRTINGGTVFGAAISGKPRHKHCFSRSMPWHRFIEASLCGSALFLALPANVYACTYGTKLDIAEVHANGLVRLQWQCLNNMH